MNNRDLHVIRCYFQQFEKTLPAYAQEIKQVIGSIDSLSDKMIGLETSITLSRPEMSNCTICLKRVLADD